MSDNRYNEATQWLFTQLPMFHRKGAEAYKPGLATTLSLSALYGNPHLKLRTIHVAGTNGKGSTAHTLAAILQSAGYKVGLYTSPHLVDFRERIRVNGEMIPESEVISFVEDFRRRGAAFSPSFFELATIMAFRHFALQDVDVAVIEVGLGGRLDSTNIITPDLSVITNISLDHTGLLGATEEEIAGEKAGIIKKGVPVVIGESAGKVREVFADKARETGSDIIYADDRLMYDCAEPRDGINGGYIYRNTPWGDIEGALSGICQPKNANTILHALSLLKAGVWNLPVAAVRGGFRDVCALTGLQGRWMPVSTNPPAICDTGHNIGGWEYIVGQLKDVSAKKIMVVGFVNDKDVRGILRMIATIPDKELIFTNAPIPRAIPAEELAVMASEEGLSGDVIVPVEDAYREALRRAASCDTPAMVYVGGSNFVVAELLQSPLVRLPRRQ